jgi:acetyl-CoA acetyltransferase
LIACIFLSAFLFSNVDKAMSQKRKVYVVGVGMTKFEKPGARQWDYPDMGAEAVQKALRDANLPYTAIQQVCVGYVYVRQST